VNPRGEIVQLGREALRGPADGDQAAASRGLVLSEGFVEVGQQEDGLDIVHEVPVDEAFPAHGDRQYSPSSGTGSAAVHRLA
jgi:hypothetical protein